jgi:hypothetical protein
VFSDAHLFNSTLSVPLQEEEHQVEDIRTFVTHEYDRRLWLARVLQVNDSEIQLTFFHHSGSGKVFMYLSPPDIL